MILGKTLLVAELFVGKELDSVSNDMERYYRLYKCNFIFSELPSGRKSFEATCNSCAAWHRRFLGKESFSRGNIVDWS